VSVKDQLPLVSATLVATGTQSTGGFKLVAAWST
jgi:hypothetical protein